jgi:cation diffusion facilitator family transporter
MTHTGAPHEHHSHDHDHHTHDRGHRHYSGITELLHGFFVPHSHDPADSVDDALEASAQGVRAVKLSLIGLGVTAALQLVVVAVSGSVALLADTVHNFSDALTAGPLWVAFVIGRRPASRRFTFGYGRAEDLAGLFIVGMIAVSAVLAAAEAIQRLVEPRTVTNLGWVLVAGLVGFLGNELVAVYRIGVGRRIGSAALIADGVHARTDGFTSLAVVLGAAGVWAGFPLADPIVGLLICAVIVVLLIGTSRDVGRRLLDGVDPHLVDRSEGTLSQLPGVNSVTNIQARWIGHRLSVHGTVMTDRQMTIEQFHQLEHQADQAVRESLPGVGAVRLHATIHH